MPAASRAKGRARKRAPGAARAGTATKKRAAKAAAARGSKSSSTATAARRAGSTAGSVVARAATRRSPAPSSGRLRKAQRADSDFAFTTVLAERGTTGLWPQLVLSPEASAWLRKHRSTKLIVNVEGVMFRRTARPDGKGGHFILFNAEMRERSGVETGDRVRIGLEVDHAPNLPEVPRELEQALRSDPPARKAYGAMPDSHRRAYAEFIEEAKRPETKIRRIQQALRMMAQWGEERAARKRR